MAKILIVRLGAMGDILHALPTVTTIRAAFPDAHIGWLVESKWSELLAAQDQTSGPAVNMIHSVDTRRSRRRESSGGILAEISKTLRAIRALHYDIALDFQGNIKSAIFSVLSGARIKAGFVNPREPLARFFYNQRFTRIGNHVIEQNHGLAAQALNHHLHQPEAVKNLMAPELPNDPAATAWADAEIQRLGIASFVIINPGAGWGAKQWPPDRYGEVAKALSMHGLKTLVNAVAGEEALAASVIQASGGNAFELHCTVGQLVALTRRARLFVGGDTGPLHLAAALGVPVVGLFGPTDPVRTGPFGTKAIALRHPESKTTFSHHAETEEGLLKISAEEVISASRWLLGSGHA
ncbi:MAG TPA: lipopolysaccharide heptosyltransferase I [Candidatus Angelobacter sp.]|jgi:heptosyltransferase-1|nr:lipopolysaccharide heptosyltransferase I [Candidatus Angelobacter sp.]